jgi:hypothetical protein
MSRVDHEIQVRQFYHLSHRQLNLRFWLFGVSVLQLWLRFQYSASEDYQCCIVPPLQILQWNIIHANKSHKVVWDIRGNEGCAASARSPNATTHLHLRLM